MSVFFSWHIGKSSVSSPRQRNTKKKAGFLVFFNCRLEDPQGSVTSPLVFFFVTFVNPPFLLREKETLKKKKLSVEILNCQLEDPQGTVTYPLFFFFSSGEGKLRDEVKHHCLELSIIIYFFSPLSVISDAVDEVIWRHATPPLMCVRNTWGDWLI